MPDFEDPFKPPPDATVVRPRPGAGRRPPSEPPLPPRPPVPGGGWPGDAGAGDGRAGGVRPSRFEPIPESAREFLGAGLNPLVQAASPLLVLAGQLRGTLSGPDVGALRRHVLEEIRRFEERARAAHIPNEVVLAARYALCAALDEAVLSTPWGAHSEWAQQTLLVALHREAWGGEKFFDMLGRIVQEPSRHIDLMELQYLCLAFGFAGKYQVQSQGHARLAEVQQGLYARIREFRGAVPDALSRTTEGVKDRRNPLIRYVPWWVVGIAVVVLLAGVYVTYRSLLRRTTTPVKVALATLRNDAFNTKVAAPVAGPTLRSLLRDQEASGAVAIAEEGGRTTITLPASDLFASASADLNPRYRDLLGIITAAINRVPGRVLIVGHTDSQPIRSVRFSDNLDLSRARATSVLGIMRQRIDNPARLQANGVGDAQPIDRVNQARNRRVEIVHVAGS
jgi:type VI secretion system protein ImpK